MTATELIAAIEAATEGSHELDCEIWDTFGWHKPRSIKRYTTSLDAAESLMPADVWWLLGCGQVSESEPLWGMRVVRAGDQALKPIALAEHRTSEILCRCIAALRAREAAK